MSIGEYLRKQRKHYTIAWVGALICFVVYSYIGIDMDEWYFVAGLFGYIGVVAFFASKVRCPRCGNKLAQRRIAKQGNESISAFEIRFCGGCGVSFDEPL